MSSLHPQTMRQAATYLVGERFIRMLIGFFVHTWMARSFAPEDFGFISFTVKSVGVYFAFSLFGADEVIIKLLVQRSSEERPSIIKTALVIRVAMGFLGWIVLCLITGLSTGFFNPIWMTVMLFGLTIPLQALTVYELPFMAQMTMKPIFFVRNTSYVVGACAKFIALFSCWSRSTFIGLYAVEDILWKVLIYLQSVKQRVVGGRWNSLIAKLLWFSGLLAFASSFVVLFDQRLPFLFLQNLNDRPGLAAYAVVVALMDMAILLPMSLAAAVFPKVVKARESSEEEYLHERQRMSNYLVWSGIFFAAPVVVLAPYILDFLYQGKYPHAVSILRGMGCISIWTFFNIGRFKWFALENALDLWLGLAILSLLLQALSLHYLLPVWGLEGVVASIVFAQLGASLLMAHNPKVRQSLKIFANSFIWKK